MNKNIQTFNKQNKENKENKETQKKTSKNIYEIFNEVDKDNIEEVVNNNICSFKNILTKKELNNYDESKENINKFYLQEKGKYKMKYENNNKIKKIIHNDDIFLLNNIDKKSINEKMNKIINIMIDRWNNYEEKYIDLYGYDNFEKYHLFPVEVDYFDNDYYEDSSISDDESSYYSDNELFV
jgi:hypothetical protein